MYNRKAICNLSCDTGSIGGASGKNPSANTGDEREAGLTTRLEDPLEYEMAIHSSILA